MSTSFKTALFGGFDKEDVVTYIEKMAKEHQDKIDSLEQENETLRKKVTELSDLRDSLSNRLLLMDEENTSAEALRSHLAEALQRAEAAEREAAMLREPADEYLHMKDHIADIEINAHKRTEEFRAQAIEKLHGIIDQQRQWLDRQRDLYGAMNSGLLEKIHQCEQDISQADYSEFDRMQDLLSAMESELQE